MLNTQPTTVDQTLAPDAVATQSGLARRWTGVLTGVLLAVGLAACGTNVKLDETPVAVAVPVQERTPDGAAQPPVQPQVQVQTQGVAQGLAQSLAQPPVAASASTEQRAVSGVQAAAGVQAAGADAAQAASMQTVVYFDFDSYVVRDDFTVTLEAHAKNLAANSSLQVALEGHADERGGREYNLALGQKRSEAVRRVLSVLGVKEAQMEAVSLGEEKPAVSGYDEDAYAKNRRVEITYR